MVRSHLKYGDGLLPLQLPDSFRVDVLSPKTTVQSKGDEAVIESAMNQPIAEPPLHDLVRPGMNVAVGLTKADADMMEFAYFESLEAAVQGAHEETGGSDIAVLTHGGISWPYLARSESR